MIREYLEKIQKELIDQKRETEKKIISLENTEKENIKFIELLDEINDPNYEAFTPRTVNARNKEKINELKVQQKNIIKEKGMRGGIVFKGKKDKKSYMMYNVIWKSVNLLFNVRGKRRQLPSNIRKKIMQNIRFSY